MENNTKEELEAQTSTEATETALPPKKISAIDKFFGITASGSTFKTEVIAGLTTFMAMVYILMVNAGMFSDGGLSYGGMYIATAIGAIVGTLLMALLAKMPLAQASGMGINAFIVYTLMLGGGLTYGNCMVFTLLDGVIFVILTATGLRKKIFEAIPEAVRHAIPVGIGMFIAFIGLQQAGVIINDNSTLVAFASFNILNANNAFVSLSGGTVGGMLPALVGLAGVLAIAVMSKKNVKGAVLWGILGSTALFFILMGLSCLAPESWLLADGTITTDAAIAAAAEGATPLNGAAAQAFFSEISIANPFTAFVEWGSESAGQVFISGFDFSGYLKDSSVGGLILLIVTTSLSLCMIDLFDTIGTLYGACAKGNLLDGNGVPKNMEKMMLTDAIATCAGAMAGTSTVTTFVESSSGVAAGGKTGLTSLVTAICFIIAMFLSPIASLIPRSATAAALIWVGVLMMTSVTKVDWTDAVSAIVAFLTIIVMTLGYSISKGIGVGIITYVLMKLFTGKVKEISVVTWIVAILFVATFVFAN